jgi:hypothetical protein
MMILPISSFIARLLQGGAGAPCRVDAACPAARS